MKPRTGRPRAALALLATIATVAGLAVAVAAPAQAAPPASPSAKQTANYLPAGCNSAQESSKGRDFARCFALIHTDGAGKVQPNDATPPATALGPAQIQNAYNLPASGQGQTVAVVDAFGYSTAEADLAVFRSQYGLPPCTTANGCFKKVDQNGGTNYPADDSGWALESALDLDAVSSACPACNIMLVEGNDNGFDNLGIAVNTAVSLGAKFVSNSYGVAGEMPNEQTYDHYYDHPGVAVTASTGDAGNVSNWPAADPNVVAVAGTKLAHDSSTRGWHETAWDSGGSGCSPYEPRPDYQQALSTNCPNNRAQGDISADADPDSGLAVYDSIPSQFGVNWLQIGGTSLSSPLTAAMYALAGTPVAGTYPVTYPYQAPAGALNDITEGTNGSCGNVLCTAGPGWDGPTGLGTPNGVAALSTAPHGTVAGKITDAATSKGIAGATVRAGDYSATTGADGSYTLSVPVGTYDVTAQAFGYSAKTTTGVAVTDGHATALNVALASVPSQNVSGTITDGSGHGWPLYAKIAIDGYPDGAVYSNAFTGHYSVDLPEGATYKLHVSAVAQGYQTKDVSVDVGSSDEVVDTKVAVDPDSCSAPGYGYKYNGTGASFTGWTGSTPQDGWTIVDNKGNGQVWQFDNPGNRAIPPGGDSDFAILDSDHYGPGNSQDSSLVSPVSDLSTITDPTISFDTYYRPYTGSVADVDVSVDGGATWSNVWEQTSATASGHVSLPIPQAAGKTTVQARFHYTGSFAYYWQLDNVLLGTRSCVPQHGGLVAGLVTDNNTHQAVNGAKVASNDAPGELGVSAATPDDAALADGYYWLFSSVTGKHQFSVSDGKYAAASASVNVATNYVTRKNWVLEAGHLTVTPGSVSVSETLGVAKSKTVKITNDGTKPAHVKLSEQGGAFTPMGQTKPTSQLPGAPVTTTKGNGAAYKGAMTAQVKSGAKSAAAQSNGVATPSAAPWTSLADYPTDIVDNAATAVDGTAYSVGGFDGTADSKKGWKYDADAQQWVPIADVPVAVEEAKASSVGGTIYLTGGWVGSDATKGTYSYDPSANTWTKLADMPTAVSAAGGASLDGKVYSIGGCTTGNCTPSTGASAVFDPAGNSWAPIASYPEPAAFLSCAGIAGEVVCAGGVNANTNASLTTTYAYDPGSDSWTKVADMPGPLWGSAYSGANDKLQVATGTPGSGESNAAYEYDPATNSWATLPSANNTVYRGSGACGLYQIGGGNSSIFGTLPTALTEVLPGYDQCGAAPDVPWLSESTNEFDLAPGNSVTVTVTMDSSVVAQPGSYAAQLGLSTDTPYSVAPIGATMQVNPPATWGKITGTVTSATGGAPIAGATVQIGTFNGTGQVTFTLKTDTAGHYQLWLDARYSPLQLIVAKDGYQPQVKSVKITKGTTVTSNFVLKKA
jgi:N-acetylneuraminic acid mutarotase